MTNDGQQPRDFRVLAAGAVLALQVAGLILLLLLGQDRLAALRGESSRPAAVASPVSPSPSTTPGSATGLTAPTAEPTAQPEATAAPESTAVVSTVGEASVLAPEDVAVDVAALDPEGAAGPGWLAQVVEGVAPAAPGQAGMPPHLLLSPPDTVAPGLTLAAPDAIDLTRPQMRVVPTAALLAWLQARNDTAGQDALRDLQSLLEQQPAAGEAVVPPSPLLSGSVQALAAHVTYERFRGGRGIAYIGRVTTGSDAPATNQSGLTYLFQGITADGRQYVFMSWPVAAAFLPDAPDDVPADTAAALAADRQAYYADMKRQIESATADDLQPAPAEVAAMFASLVIGPGAAQETGPGEAPGTPGDVAGFVWNWTGRAGGDGDESAVEKPQDYSLIFWPDGTFSLRADCNVGRGTYTSGEDGTLTLQVGPMTRAACGPDSRDREFLQALAGAKSLAFNESGDMVMTLSDGSSAVFANAGPAESDEAAAAEPQPEAAEGGLAGLSLQWPGFTDASGNMIAVDNPADYSLLLLPDGTFTFRADCKMGRGVYQYAPDGMLTLTSEAVTGATCPAGSQSDAFLTFLDDVIHAAAGADGNPVLTTADGRHATFVNLGPVEDVSGAAQGDDGDTAALRDLVWQWTALGGPATDIQVTHPERYYLVFLEDGTYLFVADCNQGSGTYTGGGSTLALVPGPMTLVACENGSQSEQFIGLFSQIERYARDGDTLTLVLADGGQMTLTSAGLFSGLDTGGGAAGGESGQGAPLSGAVWRWATFRDMKQDYTVPDTSDYTVVFNADGTVNVVADCNSASGTYVINGDGTMTIALLAMTRVACPEGSLGNTFIEYLNQAGPFTVDEGGVLTLELLADGGRMTFIQAP